MINKLKIKYMMKLKGRVLRWGTLILRVSHDDINFGGYYACKSAALSYIKLN